MKPNKSPERVHVTVCTKCGAPHAIFVLQKDAREMARIAQCVDANNENVFKPCRGRLRVTAYVLAPRPQRSR